MSCLDAVGTIFLTRQGRSNLQDITAETAGLAAAIVTTTILATILTSVLTSVLATAVLLSPVLATPAVSTPVPPTAVLAAKAVLAKIVLTPVSKVVMMRRGCCFNDACSAKSQNGEASEMHGLLKRVS